MQLGKMLYPLVSQFSGNKGNVPRIVGMLVDFQVFEEQEILDFLINMDELKDRIKEAENLINQKS